MRWLLLGLSFEFISGAAVVVSFPNEGVHSLHDQESLHALLQTPNTDAVDHDLHPDTQASCDYQILPPLPKASSLLQTRHDSITIGKRRPVNDAERSSFDASLRKRRLNATSEHRDSFAANHQQVSIDAVPVPAMSYQVRSVSKTQKIPGNVTQRQPSPVGLEVATVQQISFLREGTTVASKKTIASSALCLGTVLLGLSLYWRVDKGRDTGQGKGRSDLLDNAKVVAQFLAIYIGLFYHNLVPIEASPAADYVAYSDRQTWLFGSTELLKTLHDGFSALVIPMLCFISGVNSQGDVTLTRLRNFVQNLLLPTLIWVYFAKPVILATLMDPRPDALAERIMAVWRFQSFRAEWYLECLVLWRGSVFLIWSHFEPSVSFIAMLAISGIAGYMNLNGPLWYLKLDDAMGFLPYFAVGYVFPFDEACRVSTSKPIPGWAAGALVLLWVFAVIPLAGLLPEGYGNYHCCSAGAIFRSSTAFDYSLYWTRRLARVVLELPPTLLMLFYLVPKGKKWWTWIGQHMVYPYLFHEVANHWRNQLILLIQPSKMTSIYAHVGVLLLHAPYAIMVLVFFASKPWRILFSWCLEPTWLSALLKEETKAGNKDSEKSAEVPDAFRALCSKSFGERIVAKPSLTPAAPVEKEIPPPEFDADDASTPEVPNQSRPSQRHRRWQTTGAEIPWQQASKGYYPWLSLIFLGMLTCTTSSFFYGVLINPGWQVLLSCFDSLPLTVAVPTFFSSLFIVASRYLFHYFRLRGTDKPPEKPVTLEGHDAPPATHAIVICAYKEPLDVLIRTFNTIAQQQTFSGYHEPPIIVFATEARDDTAESIYAALKEHMDKKFEIILTTHVFAEGEAIGKSSNENWAVKQLYRKLVDERGLDPFEVLVTIADADSLLSPTYLMHLEASFRSQRDGRRLIYNGPLNVYRNIDDAGLLVQCYEMNRCHQDVFHNPFMQYHPQSNYSLTLGFCQELDFWTPDVMPEDIHTANRAMINNFGSKTTVAIPAIICNDTVVQFGDRYVQALRHQWGSMTEFAWALALLFESKLSFPSWWALFSVEANREGAYLDIARMLLVYIATSTIFYLGVVHWSSIHWKGRLYIGFYISRIIWGWLWFWLAEWALWHNLLKQFKIKKPSPGRWIMIAVTMPFMLFVGQIIFFFVATAQSLYRITFLEDLTYVCAPKGDGASPAVPRHRKEEAESISTTASSLSN
jgi:cellulose synthase/poly-beta-1,6-N-acetylglucosamine synthase-like glycosyltransferase